MKIQRRHLLMAAGAFLGMVLLGCLAVLGTYLYVRPSLPPVGVLKEVQLQEPMRVYTRDGMLIAEFGEQKRAPMHWDDIPQQVVAAFLAAEDDRFFAHPGVDYQGLLRAGINHLVTGDRSQGGGTITMQLAREFFLTREKTYIRKLREIFLAFRIENELSKEEILTLYLNKIFLGNRAYGVAAASQVYYGVDVHDLTLAQAATLAATAQRPSENNPLSATQRFMERRAYVLGRMHTLGWIDDTDYREAMSEPHVAALHALVSEVEAPYIAEMVRAEVLRRHGLDAYTLGLRVYTSVVSTQQDAANRALRSALHEYDFRHGYRGPVTRVELDADSDDADYDAILAAVRAPRMLVPAVVIEVGETEAVAYTRRGGRVELPWPALEWARPRLEDDSLGARPRAAGEVLSRGDVVLLLRAGEEWRLSQLPEVQGALVAIDAHDGAILAMTGGYDFTSSQFNRAVQATRQPGSAFKPFIYAAALERGFTPATVVNDAPVVFEDDEALERDWRPRNDSGRFYGPTRLREALTLSRNLVSVRVLRSIGAGYTVDFLAERFGFDRRRLPRDLSISLGSGAMSPLEMAKGYAVFANGGHRVEPWLLLRIEDADGVVAWEAEPAMVCAGCLELPVVEEVEDGLLIELVMPRLAERVLDPQDAFLMDEMLRDVVRRGTGRPARVIGRNDLAGKTGSTNEHQDAWFAGYGGGVSAVAWVGFDQGRQLGVNEYGGRAALPMWIEFMRTALDDRPEVEQLQPPGIVMARISPETGLPIEAGSGPAMFEYFREEDLIRLEADARAAMQREGDDDSDRDDTILF